MIHTEVTLAALVAGSVAAVGGLPAPTLVTPPE
jgi:hypothetical protein